MTFCPASRKPERQQRASVPSSCPAHLDVTSLVYALHAVPRCHGQPSRPGSSRRVVDSKALRPAGPSKVCTALLQRSCAHTLLQGKGTAYVVAAWCAVWAIAGKSMSLPAQSSPLEPSVSGLRAQIAELEEQVIPRRDWLFAQGSKGTRKPGPDPLAGPRVQLVRERRRSTGYCAELRHVKEQSLAIQKQVRVLPSLHPCTAGSALQEAA